MALTAAADLTVHVGADTADAEQGLGRVDQAVQKTGKAWGPAGLMMGAGAAAIGGGFLMAAKGAMDFEGAMSDVSASLLTTDEQLEDLSQLALQIGQDTIFNATQGAQAIEALGLAGVGVEDILNGAGEAATNLAAATGEQLPLSAETMANAMNIFGISGKDATDVADTMTAAMNESSLTLNDFRMGMASAGVMANAVGMSFEQTSAALALFSSRGMTGADAGTALRSMLTYMANPTAEAAELFDQLGFSLQEGIESGDLMAYTAEKLQNGLGHLSEAERLAALETLFGADAQRVANILYEEGAEGVQNMTEKMVANGQAQEASRRRMRGLRGAMESLSGSVETFFIVLGSALLPILTRVAEAVGDLVNWFANLPEPMLQLIAGAGAVIGAMLALGSAIAGVMAAGGLIPGGFAAVGSAMVSILGPIALVIAAIAGLYVAWETNFLGIRDIVGPVIDTIVSGISQLINYFQRVVETGHVVNQAFRELPPALQPIALALGRVVDALADLYRAFVEDGLLGLLQALPGELAQIGRAFLLLGAEILGAIQSLDWGAIGSAIWTGLDNAVRWAFAALAPVVGWILEVGVPTIVGWLADVAGSAWEGLKAAAGWTWNNYEDIPGITLNILDWFIEASKPLWQTVVNKVYGWLGGYTGAGDGTGGATATGSPRDIPIGVLGVAIKDWAVTQATSLYSKVNNAIKGWLYGGGVSGGGGLAGGAVGGGGTLDYQDQVRVRIMNWALELLDRDTSGDITAAEVIGWIDDALEGMIGIDVELQDWKLELANPENDLTVMDVIGWLDEFLEGIVGVDVELQDWKLELANPDGDLTAMDVIGWIDDFLEGLIGVDVELQDWKLKLANPDGDLTVMDVIGWIDDELESLIGVDVELQDWNLDVDIPEIDWPDWDPIQAIKDWLPDSIDWDLNLNLNILGGDKGDGKGGGVAASTEGEALSAAERAKEQLGGGGGGDIEPFLGAEQSMSAGGGLAGLFAQQFAQARQAIQTGMAETSTAMQSGLAQVGVAATTGMAPVSSAVLGGIRNISTGFTAEPAKWPPPVAGAIGAAASALVGGMSTMGSAAGTGFARILGSATGNMPGVPATVGSNMGAAAGSMSSNLGTMAGDAASQFGAIQSSASSEMQTARDNVTRSATEMNTQSSLEIAGMKAGIALNMLVMRTNAISEADQMASGVRNAIADGALRAAAAMRDGIGAIPGIINSVGGSAIGAAQALGRNVGSALAMGLASMLGAVRAAAASLANEAASAMALALQVSSPSRVALWIAHMVGRGLIEGLADYLRPVTNMATAIAQGIGDSLEPAFTAGALQPADYAGLPAMQPGRQQTLQPIQYYDNRVYTVKVDDLPELQRAAEFLNDLQSDHERVYGGT